MMISKPQAITHNINAHIEGTVYVNLRWKFHGKRESIALGKFPDSPTPLLDLALENAPKLQLFALRRLLVADKSMRS